MIEEISFCRQTAEPETEPVSVSAARDYLRLDGTEHDARLGMLISAARGALEDVCWRAFARREFVQGMPRFPRGDGAVRLRYPPLVAVSKIEYLDASGETVELAATAYRVCVEVYPGTIRPAAGTFWPRTAEADDAVRVTFSAGPEAADISPVAKVAILAAVADLFEHAGENEEMSLTENKAIKRLIDALTYRRFF